MAPIHSASSGRPITLLSVVLVLLVSTPAQCESPVDRIVGTWRGSSTCVNREAAPACKDEQVIYEISPTPGKSNAATVKADKIEDGRRVPMGTMDFTYDAQKEDWKADLETPRVHALWRLRVQGPTITGTLTLLPSGTVVRNVNLQKEK